MAAAARGSGSGAAVMHRPQKCKVVVLGDQEVGKTSLITRYVYSGTFDEKYQATIGVDFLAKTVQLQDGGTLRLQLWDTAGQEKFRSLARSYVRDARAAVLVYDVTKRLSLDGVRAWAQCVRNECEDGPIIVLVGNKTDLSEQREVAADEGKREAQELGACVFIETSAKDGTNVDALFQQLACALPTLQQPHRRAEAPGQDARVELAAAGDGAEERKKCAC
uniref:Uncharacterized protein n=1 Tax=Pyrodinium bahamense TaxID=73915 RepID=A0A7S0AFA3_9DINO|mmetsp:Transcript_32848/g.90728  ORF Transcript_32848/g.90728 Transcript_32848/m.90728 type:complete len:221 (+) Transcript_32848:60-722(+)